MRAVFRRRDPWLTNPFPIDDRNPDPSPSGESWWAVVVQSLQLAQRRLVVVQSELVRLRWYPATAQQLHYILSTQPYIYGELGVELPRLSGLDTARYTLDQPSLISFGTDTCCDHYLETTRSQHGDRRRGLAPVELVLWFPVLLMVMALIVNYANMTSWRLRGEMVARDAVSGAHGGHVRQCRTTTAEPASGRPTPAWECAGDAQIWALNSSEYRPSGGARTGTRIGRSAPVGSW